MTFPYPVDLKEEIDREEIGPMAVNYNFTLGVEEDNLVHLLDYLTSNKAVITSIIEFDDHVEVQGHYCQVKKVLTLRNTVLSSENVVEPEVPTKTGPETMEV